MAKAKDWLGTLADLLQIGGFVVFLLTLAGVGASVFFDVEVPLWVPVVIAGLLSIGLIIFYRVGRRRRETDPSGLERLEQDVAVATTYLAEIKDFLGLTRAAAAVGSPTHVLRELERVRVLVFTAVIQGTNTARGEHIRCAYLEPDPL